jgi:enoyl-CoA hydratase
VTSPLTVRRQVEGPVLVVTIDRPDVRNAIDRPTASGLAAAFREFDATDELSVAVLTGAGGVFCAGADLKALAEAGGRGTRLTEDGDGPLGPTRLSLAKPVIAAVEGWAVAGGLELALWCDLRVAATDAVFGVFCRRWGVPLVDGGTIRLPRLIGHSHAMDLILTGRGVSGAEAQAMGLANRLTPSGQSVAHAVSLAKELAAHPQGCLRSDRQSAYEQWDLPLDQALANETRRGLEVIASGETLEGARRFAGGAGRQGAAGGAGRQGAADPRLPAGPVGRRLRLAEGVRPPRCDPLPSAPPPGLPGW